MGVFSVDVDRSEAVIRLRLRGEVDLAAKPELDAALAGARHRREPLLMDLSETTFFDSSGVAFLIRAMAAARDGDWELRVAPRISGPATTVLELTGVLERLSLAAPDA
jgi:anti-anti-sigma factor